MSKNSTSKRMGRSSGSNFDCLRFENSTVLLWCAARVLAIAPNVSYYYQQLPTGASHISVEGQVGNCWWNKRCLIILWAPPRSHENLQIEQLARKVDIGNGGTLRLFSVAVMHYLLRCYRFCRGRGGEGRSGERGKGRSGDGGRGRGGGRGAGAATGARRWRWCWQSSSARLMQTSSLPCVLTRGLG